MIGEPGTYHTGAVSEAWALAYHPAWTRKSMDETRGRRHEEVLR